MIRQERPKPFVSTVTSSGEGLEPVPCMKAVWLKAENGSLCHRSRQVFDIACRKER